MKSDTGERLQTAASTIATIMVVFSIITGIAIIALNFTLAGVLTGVIVGVLGCVTAWAVELILSCIGEMTSSAHARNELLKKLTEAIEPLKSEYLKKPVADTSVVNVSKIHNAEPVTAKIEDEHGEAHGSNKSLINNSVKAHFPSRSQSSIKCTLCGKSQQSSRNTCYACGCNFVYDDEL